MPDHLQYENLVEGDDVEEESVDAPPAVANESQLASVKEEVLR